MKLFPDVFNEFAAESGRLRTKASREGFKCVIRQLQNDHPGQPVSRFTSEQLTRFCLKPGLAPASIRQRRSIVQVVFGWAEWKGYCRSNPASSLTYTVSPGKHNVRLGNWLEEPQIAQVLRACPDTQRGRRDRLILLFGFMMGLRRGDIEQLRWSRFSTDLKQLRLTGKGQKMVVLGVPAQLARELSAWRQEAPAGTDTVIPGYRIINLPHREESLDWDSPMQRCGIGRVVKACGERCGVPLAPHDLRRSFAGLLESKGTPVTDIQRAMRHESVGTTSIYLDKNPRRTVAVTEGLTIDY